MSDSKLPTLSKSMLERLKHPSFPQPINTNVKLWRYMNLSKFISLLDTKALYLSRLDRLSDLYEGSTTVATINEIRSFLKNIMSDAEPEVIERAVKFLDNSFRDNRSKHYISCWHMNCDESEAMWRLYGGSNREGIVIQSTYSKLIESIEQQDEVYIGVVNYIDHQNYSFKTANSFLPVMHKGTFYAHENEVRLVKYFNPSSEKLDSQPEKLLIPWDAAQYIDKIFVNPYADDYYFEAVKSVLNAMTPALLSILQWSRMRVMPF